MRESDFCAGPFHCTASTLVPGCQRKEWRQEALPGDVGGHRANTLPCSQSLLLLNVGDSFQLHRLLWPIIPGKGVVAGGGMNVAVRSARRKCWERDV